MPKLHNLTLLLTAFIGVLTTLSAPKLFAANCDSTWHLASGLLILREWKIPCIDPFSFSAGTTPWINPAWLYDTLLAVSVMLADMGGAVLLTAALTTLIVALQCQHLLKRGFDFLAVIFAMVLMVCLFAPGISMRPQLLTMLACLLTYLTLHHARMRPALLLWLPPLFLLWSNFHGGVFIGLGIIGAFGLEALLQRRSKAFAMLVVTGLLCAGTSLLTPYGFDLYAMIHRAMTGVMVGRISEWNSPFLEPRNWFFISLLVAMPLLYRRKAPGVTLADELMLLGLIAAGATSKRHIVVLGILAAPALCGMISAHLGSSATLADISRRWQQKMTSVLVTRIITSIAALSLIACLAGALLIRDWDALLLPTDKYPRQEIDALMQRAPGCRLYAYYDYGGLVIARSGTKLPIFVDGRAENVYPNKVLHDANTITDLGKGWQKLLDDYRVEALLMPKKHAIHKKLRNDPSWELLHTGKVAKIWLRKNTKCRKKF